MRALTVLSCSSLLVAGVLAAACGGSDAGIGASSPAPVDPAATPAAPSTPAPGASGPAANSGPDASTSPPAPPSAPAALACLAQLYVGTPASAAGAWSLVLPDTTKLAWDDGKTKTYDAKLASPDLEDTLAVPYPLGTIKAVSTLDDDPGRIRSDALFKATFGATAAAVQQKLVDVDFVGQNVKLHTRAAGALAKVSARLQLLIAQTPSLAVYVTGELGGTFEWRPIANTNRLSAHSYGIAIDIVVSKSNYWEWEKPLVWKNQIPQAIVDAFEAEGFAWGGRWYHYDTMHFEYRPELFAPACKP